MAYTDLEDEDLNSVYRDKLNEAYNRIDLINEATRRTTAKSTATTPVTQNLFTVSGGMVEILGIYGHITTAIAAGANNTKLVYTSTGGGAVDLCATLDIASAAIRKCLACLLYTSPSPRDGLLSRMPSSA